MCSFVTKNNKKERKEGKKEKKALLTSSGKNHR